MARRLGPTLVALAVIAAVSCGDSGGTESSPDTGSIDDTSSAATDETSEPPTPTSGPRETDPVEPLPPPMGPLPDDTGPELQWIEVATDADVYPGEVTWTGSFFVIAGHTPSGIEMMRSAGGHTWNPIRLPDGFIFEGVHAAGESMVIWGIEPAPPDEAESTTELPFSEPARSDTAEETPMFFSTDAGVSWSELDRWEIEAEQPTSPYIRVVSGINGAAINNDVVVARVTTATELDIARVLSDHGFDPLSEWHYDVVDGGVAICVLPSPSSASTGETCADELSVSYDEMGLSTDERQAVEMMMGTNEIYRSIAGGPFEPADVDVSDGISDALVVVAGEFVGTIMRETGQSLYRSSDGLHWEVASPAGAELGNLTSDGASLYADDWSQPQVAFMRSTDAGRTWSELSRGSPLVNTVIGGPAGLAAIGELRDEGIPDEPGLQASIEKDGYIVQVRADGGVNVVDAETGETLLAFGPDELEADEPPETIIEEQVGDSFTVTFLDPDTLEPLITITEQDLSEALGAPGGSTVPEFLIGWSADGEHWGWQTATEAFDTNGLIQLAVGDGAVVAVFEEFTDTPDERPTVRIFTAHTS